VKLIVETAAGIAFGRAVSEGSNAGGALGGATKFLGLSVRSITEVITATRPSGHAPALPEHRRRCWRATWGAAGRGCHAPCACDPHDSTTGQLNPVSAGVAIPGSRYITSAGAGALAKLRLTVTGPGA
jgi:hypothetical protein